jgi:hypothetical protein
MAKFTGVAGWDALAKIARPAAAPIRASRLVSMGPLWDFRPGRINWICTCTPLIPANGNTTNGISTAVAKCNVDAICQ